MISYNIKTSVKDAWVTIFCWIVKEKFSVLNGPAVFFVKFSFFFNRCAVNKFQENMVFFSLLHCTLVLIYMTFPFFT